MATVPGAPINGRNGNGGIPDEMLPTPDAERKSMKSTDDLPDDEGTMFIAWSPNANFAVSGRRGRDGELYVGSIYQDASMSTLKGVKHSIEQIKSTGVDVELVTGAEADKLFTEMAQRLQSSGAEQQEGKPN
jgi:hypothetical protein